MKILVLAGGLSAERDVSLTSGALVCQALRKLGHQAIVTDIYLGLPPGGAAPAELFAADTAPADTRFIRDTAPDIATVKALRGGDDGSLIGPGVLELCLAADIVFIGLHGEDGENGKLQAAFDILGIKYTGSGPVGSMLAMNKMLTKQILLSYDILTARGFLLRREEADLSRLAVDYHIPYPCMVKPCHGGSSIGLTKVSAAPQLHAAIELAFRYGDQIIIEEFITGREFSVAVLDKQYLPVMEVSYESDFFDYFHKYSPGAAKETCPANIPPELALSMQQTALKTHQALGLEVYSRIDFIVDYRGGIYVLEANTLPGMTPTSFVPQEAHAAGISYEELCQRIIDLSLKRRA